MEENNIFLVFFWLIVSPLQKKSPDAHDYSLLISLYGLSIKIKLDKRPFKILISDI